MFLRCVVSGWQIMMLTEYYKRHDAAPVEDLSGDGTGICGVGDKLVEELFALPLGLSPQLVAAIEAFSAMKKERADKMADLATKAAVGGVKGMAAKNELIILESGDKTESNRMELTLDAAKRKASKQSGSDALEAQQKIQQAEVKAKHDEQRAKMDAKRAMFEKKA